MSKPPYVDRGGEIVFSQPFEANGVNFYGFMIQADEAVLTDYFEKTFNEPSGGEVKFKPAGGYVMLVFCNLKELVAKDEPYSNYGKFTEAECAFWVPAIDEKRERLFWAFPFIWVDNEYAMAMGRELYGFPKGIAKFQIPDDQKDASSFAMTTLGVRKFGPSAAGEVMDMITINKTKEVNDSSAWSGIKEGAEAVFNLFSSEEGVKNDVRLMFNELKDLIHLEIPFVFLKQFRDVADGSKACYQSIVETPCRVAKWDSGGVLHGEYEVNIIDCDSHPMREKLGLAEGPMSPELSFWCRFDFEIGNGTEIWKA